MGVFDGLAVVEDVLGLGRFEACKPPHVPVPKPGPCPGLKKAAGPVSKIAKKVAAKPKTAADPAKPKVPKAPKPAGPRPPTGAPLEPAELKALQQYTGGAFANVNKLLRGQRVGPSNTRAAQETIQGMERIMSEHKIPRDITVTRAVGLDALGGDPESFIGRTVADKAYLSTSMATRPLGVFKDKPAVITLRVPAGTPGFIVGANTTFTEEKEVVLGRGLPIKFESATYNPRSGKWSVTASIVAR